MRGRIKAEKVGPYAPHNVDEKTRVYQLRIEASLTQPELAKLAGVSERSVRNIERYGCGNANVYERTLAVIGHRISASFMDDPLRELAIRLAALDGDYLSGGDVRYAIACKEAIRSAA
jgi:DNA-binding XRE family transcriptional regulator